MTSRILVADDDPGMLKSLAIMLRREGYIVSEAPGGKEAIAELEHNVFELVITDLRMRPISGLDLLHSVKQMSPGTEVMLMTAYGSIETAVKAMKMGAFDFITKPINWTLLLYRLRYLLRWHRTEGGKS